MGNGIYSAPIKDRMLKILDNIPNIKEHRRGRRERERQRERKNRKRKRERKESVRERQRVREHFRAIKKIGFNLIIVHFYIRGKLMR